MGTKVALSWHVLSTVPGHVLGIQWMVISSLTVFVIHTPTSVMRAHSPGTGGERRLSEPIPGWNLDSAISSGHQTWKLS